MDARSSTSRHPKKRQFTDIGLFRDLDSFAQFEDRVARLETAQERGDAFEVFAEAYIATQKSLQAEEVWPEGTIPHSILRKFKLPLRDLGVDGVFRTWSSKHHGYQAKFRSGRPSLTWDELSTFMGLTDEVDQRVLFTNCDNLPAVMNDRSNFFCIRGNDLNRLTTGDLKAIEEWLDTGIFQPERKIPEPHQEEAIENILAGLQTQDRVTSVMACATGKTLVSLWLAERMDSRTILVLVPSLALVRQTLHEWLKQTRWSKPRFFCVCSDRAVAKDADQIVIHQSDADFPVNTKVGEVQDFLRNDGGDTQIVFSTYHSAHVVADAMQGLPPFELGIFDEAHKTAGREGTRDSFALSDDNLPIKKRVFLTATPRHYDISKKDKEGDSKLVYSMVVPETYGPRVHALTFAEAARREIICDYKIIISIATSDMVTDEFLRRGQVIVEGDVVKSRQVANQIALLAACEKYDLKKVFTFHRSVASAKSFTGTGGQSISAHLPHFDAFHVNGTMNTALRDGFMRKFAEVDRAVMSNARCLTEGVDVPAVDMVAFLSPRKSKVDIVQATGRAMRRPRGSDKQIGYVMLPLYLEQDADEKLEDAIERTDFGEVWNVLQAMQEQDTELADIIRQMREERGRIKGFDDSRLRKKVKVLGPEISLATMRSSITVAIIDKLGATWDERFGELVAFYERYGHCNVPSRYLENQRLANWLATQRVHQRRGLLDADKKTRLDEIGFDWERFDTKWELMFDAFSKYRKTYGDCNVPARFKDHPELANWVINQRSFRRRGQLSQDRIARLDALDFEWDIKDSRWEEMFSALEEFKERYGHCNVPRTWPEAPGLSQWVNVQRAFKRNGMMSSERREKLETIGFVWELRADNWAENFNRLKEFAAEHGHCLVHRKDAGDAALRNWVNSQRKRRKRGRLSETQSAQLDSIGLSWDQRSENWEEMFADLLEYKARHGDCNVPSKWNDNLKLAHWVDNQRAFLKRDDLSSDRIERLESIGFAWQREKQTRRSGSR